MDFNEICKKIEDRIKDIEVQIPALQEELVRLNGALINLKGEMQATTTIVPVAAARVSTNKPKRTRARKGQGLRDVLIGILSDGQLYDSKVLLERASELSTKNVSKSSFFARLAELKKEGLVIHENGKYLGEVNPAPKAASKLLPTNRHKPHFKPVKRTDVLSVFDKFPLSVRDVYNAVVKKGFNTNEAAIQQHVTRLYAAGELYRKLGRYELVKKAIPVSDATE